jgi:hypothetical protein
VDYLLRHGLFSDKDSALDFREAIGGEREIQAYCHTLARSGGKKMAQVLGTRLMDERDEFTAAMVCALAYQLRNRLITPVTNVLVCRSTCFFPSRKTRYHDGAAQLAHSYSKNFLKSGTLWRQFSSMKGRCGHVPVPRSGWRQATAKKKQPSGLGTDLPHRTQISSMLVKL